MPLLREGQNHEAPDCRCDPAFRLAVDRASSRLSTVMRVGTCLVVAAGPYALGRRRWLVVARSTIVAFQVSDADVL